MLEWKYWSGLLSVGVTWAFIHISSGRVTVSITVSLLTTNNIILRLLPRSSPRKWCLSPLCQPDLSYTHPICHVLMPNSDSQASRGCYSWKQSQILSIIVLQDQVLREGPASCPKPCGKAASCPVLLFLVPNHHSCSFHKSNFLPGASSALDDISRPLQSYSHRWSSQNSSCTGHM